MTELKKRKTANFLGQPAITNPRVLADGFAATGRFAPISAGRYATSQLQQHSLWRVLWQGLVAPPTKDLGGESNRANTHFRSSRALRGWRTGSRWQSGATRDEEPGDHMLLGHEGADTNTETWHKVI